MGDRAIITSKGSDPHRVGLYLHWNGSPEQVLALLEACKQARIRTPLHDDSYSFARMAQIAGNWIGGDTGLGVGPQNSHDDGDNGVYQVDENWTVTSRSRAGAMTVAELSASEKQEYERALSEIIAANSQFFFKKKAA